MDRHATSGKSVRVSVSFLRTLPLVYTTNPRTPSLVYRGHYGKVFKGVSRNTGGPVAVKVLDRSKSRLERLETERDILAHVSHKNIVKLLDVFETPAAFIFVLEFMGGGEIFEYLVNVGPLTEHGEFAIAHVRSYTMHMYTYTCACIPTRAGCIRNCILV